MSGFTYAYPGGYAYQRIDPTSYKFTKCPAFSRPPTPPIFKPPTNNPFGGEEDAEDVKDDAAATNGDETVDAQPEPGEGEASEPAEAGEELSAENGLLFTRSSLAKQKH